MVLRRTSRARDDVSAKYTLSDYLTHHLVSVFWALVFVSLLARRRIRRELPLASAVATAALAAAVDYTITPRRLTPGFEKRLPASALIMVYTAFALGLATLARWIALSTECPDISHGHFDC